MFFRKQRKKPGPTGSGLLIENINWVFWDDRTTPGLLTRDKFLELRKIALSEREASDLNIAIAFARMISSNKRNEAAIKTRDILYKKVENFLANLCANDKNAADYWLESDWLMKDAPYGFEPENVLKAYINILNGWGYDVDWYDAKDARGDKGVLMIMLRSKVMESIMALNAQSFNKKPYTDKFWEHYAIRTSEISRVLGRPDRFRFELEGATWEFDALKSESISVNKRSSAGTLDSKFEYQAR